jgi:hypothetical protein
MDTDRFIHGLAADHGWTARPVWIVLAGALVVALGCSVSIFTMWLQMRPDVMVAMGHPFFLLKFVVTLALAGASLALVMRLVRPGAQISNWPWLLALPVVLLAGGIAADLMVPHTSSWEARLVGSNSQVCLTAIPLMSVPLLIAALAGLRHGASTRPALTGAVAGLLAGGIAATLYASHCTDDSPLFVATWYTAALALVTAAGAFAGRWVLRI